MIGSIADSDRRIFWTLAVATLLAYVGLSQSFGVAWDEPQQRAKAERLLAHWRGELAALDEPIDGAHLYGAPFDVVAAALLPIVGGDPYDVRHAVIAVVGWAGLVLAGLLAARLFTWRHGALTLGLLAVSPRYLAHAMNNPKDLPFATCATAVLLAMTWVCRTPPFISVRLGLVLGLLLGLGLNVRAGTLLFLVYLSVLVGYYATESNAFAPVPLARAGARIATITAGAVLIGWVGWPWAYERPLTAPFEALAELSHFPWGGQVLFAGQQFSERALPVGYIPRWLWMGLPPVLTVGALGSLLAFRERRRRPALVALWAVVAFPIIYILGTRSSLYDALRHLLFIVPPLAVLSSVGWWRVYDAVPRRWRTAVAVALAVGLAEPLVFQWRNHPNQTAYVQPLAGGPRHAFARYDLDYWGNCMFEAMRRLDARHDVTVSVTGWPLILLDANSTRVPGLRIVSGSQLADYRIELVRGSRRRIQRLVSLATPSGVVSTADGAALCVTLPGDASVPEPDLFDRSQEGASLTTP